jgi:FKBP-type peptidyl-prolyl cis-trans isomerase FkpA
MFKKTLLSLAMICSSFSAIAEIKDLDKTSYAIGVQTGILLSDNLKRSDELGVIVNKEELIKGVLDALSNKATLTYDESIVFLGELDKELSQKESMKFTVLAEQNKVLGKEYMTAQGYLGTIKTTASGIQYKIIKYGTGKRPSSTSDVTVHYKGVLVNGTEFDSSYKRKEPATFNLSGVIKGWTEGLQLMSEGAMYEFTIPSDLAYGDRGNPTVPPGSTLVFTVELLKVN